MIGSRRIVFALVTVVCAAGVAVVLAEGTVSLLGLESPFGTRRIPPFRLRSLDEERIKAAAQTVGPCAADVDPAVSFRLKSDWDFEVLGVVVRTDERGMRRRIGPPPGEGAARIIVLGDSVAFGFGLRDEDTIATRLEEHLAATMDPKSVRPVVRTVACPGWNFRNQSCYLLDRLADFRPDVVLMIPVANDLDDAEGILETGHRWADLDPARGDAWPHTSGRHIAEILLNVAPRLDPKLVNEIQDVGGLPMISHVVSTGLTPESSRRFREMARGVADLDARLGAHGSRFAIAWIWDAPFARRVTGWLHREIPVVPPLLWLFPDVAAGDCLEGDSHPNARFASAIAWRLAEFVVAQGWIPGAGVRQMPSEDRRYVARRPSLRTGKELEEALVRLDGIAARFIGSRVDLRDGTGIQNIYGGVAGDGMVGRCFMVALGGGGGGRIVLELERLPRTSCVYPLHLRVLVNDREIGRWDVPEPESDASLGLRRELVLPEDLCGRACIDVLVRSSNCVAARSHGVTRLESLRLVAMSVQP